MIRTLVITSCVALALLSLLSGCATLSEGECLHSDWYDIGFRDGRQGAPPDRISRHAEACGEHGIAPDRARYIDGHEAGLEHYCTRHSGLAAGQSGAAYQNVCPLPEEDAFLEDFLYLGSQAYSAKGRQAGSFALGTLGATRPAMGGGKCGRALPAVGGEIQPPR